MSYFWNVVCANLFSDVTYSVSFLVKNLFQGGNGLYKGISSFEIDGFGTVSIVRKPSISAFCE